MAEILGIPPGAQSLPATTTCPLCGGRLSIYQDSTNRGAWHYCFSCQHAGELTELAAAVWQVPLTSAVRRLAAVGLPLPAECLTDEALEAYVQGYPRRQQLATALWKRAQERLAFEYNPGINTLRQRLGLATRFSRERVSAGPGRLFGMAPDKEVENLFFDPDYDARKSRSSLFRGPRGYVLVVPYMSAPRRIGAFGFVTHGGKLVYRAIRGNEAGLLGLDLALDQGFSTLLAVNDPLLLLRLQVRHFHSSLAPLPLVAWLDVPQAATSNAWAVLDHAQIVHWAFQVTPALLRQCQRTDGRLILRGPGKPTPANVGHFLRQQPPLELTRRLVRDAKPWREVVRDWLRHGPAGQVQGVVREMRDDAEDLELLRECDPGHPQLQRHGRPNIRMAKIDGRDYVEQGGRWYQRKAHRDHLLLPGTIEVQQIVSRGGKPTYHGAVRLGERVVPFAWTKNFKTAFPGYLSKVLLEQGITTPLKSQFDYLRLALCFREPQILKGHTRIGWTGTRYRFKHFSLVRGKVVCHHEHLLPADCPGPQVSRFRCSKQILEALGQDGEHQRQLWALTISVLASVTAPRMGLQSPGVILAGSEFVAAGEALLGRLGVPTRLVWYNSGYRKSAWRHRWPYLVNMGWYGKREKMMNWFIERHEPLVANVQNDEDITRLGEHGLIVVRWPGPIPAQELADFPIDHAVLAYLRWSTGQAAPQRPACLWEFLCGDVARWLQSQGQDPAAVRGAAQYIPYNGSDPRAKKSVDGP